MKNCGEIRENISMYIDDELGAAERKAFQEHIESCEACRHELEDITEIVSVCRETEEVELPSDFRQKLHEKLIKAADAGKVTEIGSRVTKATKRTRNIRYITSIAAGVILIFLAGTFYNLGLFNSLKSGGMAGNPAAEPQMSIAADSAENAAPAAATGPADKKAVDRQAKVDSGANEDTALTSAAPKSETNRSASSTGREFTLNTAAADTDAVMSRNTVLTILTDDPTAQLEKIKTLAMENSGEEKVKAAADEDAGTGVTIMAAQPSDETEVGYKIPTMSFDAFTGALNTLYGPANIQPGAVVSEDITSKVNDLIKKSNDLDSRIKELESANGTENQPQIDQLIAEKANTDAQIDELRLDSDFTNVTIIVKKK